MSMAKTRLRRCIQLIGAGGWSASIRLERRGTMRLRCLKFGANTPWQRVRFKRGLGTRAASRAMKSSGSSTTWVAPAKRMVRFSRRERSAVRVLISACHHGRVACNGTRPGPGHRR
jgi:hypothetical protein